MEERCVTARQMAVLIMAELPMIGRRPVTANHHDKSPIPLVVDLDGTLVSTDVAVESCFVLAKKKPLELLRLPLYLANRARFKQRLAREAMPDVQTLPYHSEFLAFLREEKQLGRKLVLATAADERVAREVAKQLGLFDEVFASDGGVNLKGDSKRDRLVKEFGFKGFDYAGNGSQDLSVWKAADKAFLVCSTADPWFLRRRTAEFNRVFASRAVGGWKPYFQATRPLHWFKNVLVFLPLFTAHRLYEPAMIKQALLAFVTLCLCASSIYLLNDLIDLEEDRRHPQKKLRMLASGQLPVTHAAIMAPTLMLIGLSVGLTQPPLFLQTIVSYCLLMLAYCLKLRSLPYWDAGALATGYSLRVAAGAAAMRLAISPLLLSLIFLLFFGLSLLKRYAELISHRLFTEADGRVRGFVIKDSKLIAVSGCLSSYLAIFGLGFYLADHPDPHDGYALVWIFYLLLVVWITRMWMAAHSGVIKGDPVSFAISDKFSLVVGVLMALTALAVG